MSAANKLNLPLIMKWPDPVPSEDGEWLELPNAPLTLSRLGVNPDSYVVCYPVSIKYNGGMVTGGEWYRGYRVPPPDVPEGYELVGLGVGLQLNMSPPYATMLLRRKS